MFERLYLFLRNLAYKNRLRIRAGNELRLPSSTQRRLKKVTIKLGGRNNRLVIGEGVTEIFQDQTRGHFHITAT